MNIENLIEFVLMYAQDIAEAVEEKRQDAGGGKTGGTNGHSRISDPTALKAIRNAMEVESVRITYGAAFYGERAKKTIRQPERWLAVAQAVRAQQMRNEITKAFYESRYYGRNDWQQTCRELHISRSVYYAMRADVMAVAKLYAVHYGLFEPQELIKAV